MSTYLELDTEYLKIERSTYSFLDWLGDVGGLMDGFYLLIGIVFGGLMLLGINSKLLELVFDPASEELASKHDHEASSRYLVKSSKMQKESKDKK